MAKKAKRVRPVEPIEPANKITSATIQHPRFTITDRKAGDDKTRTGTMEFELSWDDGKLNSVKVKMHLIALWVDPNCGNAIEAFAVPLGDTETSDSVATLKAVVKEIPTIRVTTEAGFTVTGLGDCIRYATKCDACPYGSDDELYNNVEYFPSKHDAVMRVLGQLERFNAVGGFESANLNLVGDELLESVGFFRVPDVMASELAHEAPAYWGINASDIFASGGSDGSHLSYSQKERETTKMAVLFADKLRKSIEGHKII